MLRKLGREVPLVGLPLVFFCFWFFTAAVTFAFIVISSVSRSRACSVMLTAKACASGQASARR